MPIKRKKPRVLIVTPEVTYLPDRMGNIANYLTAKAGGLADVSAALVSALFNHGADVHVALPDYRAIFEDRLAPFLRKERRMLRRVMPNDRVHLAEDRAFFYLNRVYSNYSDQNIHIALAFQREVINNIVPRVRPDLIHCNDWMTGLIPAMAREMRIPCLFTIHNIHTVKTTLAHVEDRGIDAAYFWKHLYYTRFAHDYENTRETNPVDFLVSGVFAAHFVNTVSQRFLEEIVEGGHGFIAPHLRQELVNKVRAGCAAGILNAPDPGFHPGKDGNLAEVYGPANHAKAKRKNKVGLQRLLGLIEDERAPLFFWPSRLDPVQKGCRLLADIFYEMISKYWDTNLQVVFVADGEDQNLFRNLVSHHQFHQRVAVCDFNEHLEHFAYGAADFVLMPSLFEPCGLPQMIGQIYGALPVAHETGGIHDTVTHLDPAGDLKNGSGFLFKYHDAKGLMWAVDQAMDFYALAGEVKERHIARVMRNAMKTFTHSVNARRYIDLYERMLERTLLT
ncbi:MAG: glycogen synthase [Desulfobacteraceae bacterium]|nr:MAG: glycogen synthase [Desulfobacteraceae bacterium]